MPTSMGFNIQYAPEIGVKSPGHRTSCPSPPTTREEWPRVEFTPLALNGSKRNLYCWRMAGYLPYFKIGKAVRFRKAEVMEALERMKVG